jgi:hypothetical protein
MDRRRQWTELETKRIVLRNSIIDPDSMDEHSPGKAIRRSESTR